MKAVRVHNYGGPEVLTFEDISIPEPKTGEARVKIEAGGVNFIDSASVFIHSRHHSH